MWERPQIFLSYAREDQIVVAKLYRKLKGAGLRPWMDVEDIAPGEDWQGSINKAVETSAVFLAFLSPRSVSKAGVLRREMELARKIRAKKDAPLRVIPVRIEPCDAPDVLRDLQWIDLYDPDGWERLLRAIRPRRPVRAFVAGAMLLAVLCAVGLWIYSRPCDFASARTSGRCSATDAMVGATFWRLRPSIEADPPGVRSIIQPAAGDAAPVTAWTPVRMDSGAQLTKGDRFYVSIESTRPGYLYVVNREQYGDGKTGRPELIFPTLRTRQGDNRVEKDALVRLPAAEDKPPYFEVTGGEGPGYQGEIFTAILLPKALTDFAIPRDHTPVGGEQFGRWRNAWLRQATLTAGPGAGNAITEAEARAQRGSGAMVLSPDDPPPQLIYRVTPGSDGGLWVDFPIRVK
ncbi:MAG: TIR domain-containing protein, partial [Acidobacteriota bacterium]